MVSNMPPPLHALQPSGFLGGRLSSLFPTLPLARRRGQASREELRCQEPGLCSSMQLAVRVSVRSNGVLRRG